MTDLIKDKNIGDRIVPIVPDEARTFGMEAFSGRLVFIHLRVKNISQSDADQVMWYKESKEGVMLEEGITEAGAFSAWLALATSYANYNLPMIPISIFFTLCLAFKEFMICLGSR